eukprot:m.57819 g.57819  ORF g.57819 m.57819 type:complete len:254 (-) comp11634_c0_seq1:48-809(-)
MRWLDDIDGRICSSITVALLIYGAVAGTAVDAMSSWTQLWPLLWTLVALGLSSHFRAMFTSPGMAPIRPAPPPEKRTSLYCKRCEGYRPHRSHHCSTCGGCVELLDHHCIWVNNCVGKHNRKYFLLFVVYTFISCLLTIIIIIRSVLSCIDAAPHRNRDVGLGDCETWPVMSIIAASTVGVEAIMFGLFTLIMGCDQFSSIFSDQTTIEKMKEVHNDESCSLGNFSEVFGRPSVFWCLPTAPTLSITQTHHAV